MKSAEYRVHALFQRDECRKVYRCHEASQLYPSNNQTNLSALRFYSEVLINLGEPWGSKSNSPSPKRHFSLWSSEVEWEIMQIRTAIWLCLYFSFLELAPHSVYLYTVEKMSLCAFLPHQLDGYLFVPFHVTWMLTSLSLLLSISSFAELVLVLVIFMNYSLCCLTCSLKQAHKEPVLIWKSGSFCKRTLDLIYIHFN